MSEHTHRGPNGRTVAHNHNHGEIRHDHGSLQPFHVWAWQAPRQREATAGEGRIWQARFTDGYQAGRGDARSVGRAPRIPLAEIPAEVPGETGSQYVARHVGQAWQIGYARAFRFELARATV